MPFGRDTCMVPGDIASDRPRSPMGRGDLGVRTPSSQWCRLSPNYFGPCLLKWSVRMILAEKLLGFTITYGEDYCFCHYYYYYYSSFFFAPEVYRPNTKPVQVWTPSGPKNTDPVSVTLTYFSRSQTHFCAKNPKLQIHITLSFMIGFWWNFVGMDYYTTPCWWPTFQWPWPTSSGQTRNRPEIFCHRFGQI